MKTRLPVRSDPQFQKLLVLHIKSKFHQSTIKKISEWRLKISLCLDLKICIKYLNLNDRRLAQVPVDKTLRLCIIQTCKRADKRHKSDLGKFRHFYISDNTKSRAFSWN